MAAKVALVLFQVVFGAGVELGGGVQASTAPAVSTFQLGDEADACGGVPGWIAGSAGPVGDGFDCGFRYLEEALTNPDA